VRSGPRYGGPLRASTLQRWLNHWLTEAGLRDDQGNRYTLHSLRRFAAKQWLSSGLNIRQVQMLLGHEDLQTTMLYLSYDFEEIQRDAGHVDFALSPGGVSWVHAAAIAGRAPVPDRRCR